MVQKKPALALLTTLFFVMVMSLLLTQSMKTLNKGVSHLEKTNFMLQSLIIQDDILKFLKSSPYIKQINDQVTLDMFIDTLSSVPLPPIDGLAVSFSAKSAANGLNINIIKDHKELQSLLIHYLATKYNLNDPQFLIDLILDSTKGEQDYYKTNIFYDYPNFYRDHIESNQHLKDLVGYYVAQRDDHTILKVPFEDIFTYQDNNSSYKMDMNYMDEEVWSILVPEKDMYNAIYDIGGVSKDDDLQSIGLTKERISFIKKFATYNNLKINIEVLLTKDDEEAIMSFDYDLNSSKGENFEFYI